jgi:hypothetical protein
MSPKVRTKIATLVAAILFVLLFSWQIWVAAIHPDHQGAYHPASQYAAKETKPGTPDERLAAYTFWLATFTGLLAIIAIAQGFFLIRADKTARISAEAASASLELSKTTAQRQLRAYVHVSGAIVRDPLDNMKRRVVLSTKNYGQTPAYDVTMWIVTCVREFPLTESKLGPPPHGFRKGKQILPPGGKEGDIVSPISPLNVREDALLKSGAAAIYAAGEIRYRDAFGHKWRTKYRFFCNGEGLSIGAMAADTEGNEEIDENEPD